ncbi:CaiB/BaiF CoA transferase family protein [Actinoalloteichus caeruleus]|uniref:Alpha-methylacyl-CoA racemase n=1 Tax=Actinoalloteichus caeruleus DSM 43889 TaxID=1120930 RepID=A0ABT1JM00_ACTCY|nr:CaiB/BaiF CoA-transferase family protein [Actinoalloteichus caeruleus]MCP2332756.1 alpha-methylacyl-CoA racemase [Actinoalloteichus caeruleus DSM 43889]
MVGETNFGREGRGDGGAAVPGGGGNPTGTGPLAGVRVVELAGIGPAPFCGMLLADLGAEVVRVDRPDGAHLIDDGRHDLLGRGKRSVAIDLKDPRGAAAARDLAATADVLIEGFRPGVAERLGVGPADCAARNPALVYGRMTGWGQDGPLAHTAGHDIGYIAVTGVLHSIGRAGSPPSIPLNLLGDFGGGGMYLAVGVLAALLRVARGGAGQVVDAAIVDGTTHLATFVHAMLAAGRWRDERGANLLDSGAPYYEVYEASDGGYLAVGALEPKFYAEFLRLLGVPPEVGAREPDRWPELRETLAAAFRTRTRDAWATVFADSDACVAPVLSLREAAAHQQLAARRTFVTVDGVQQPAPAPRFAGTPAAMPGRPALRGEHTEEVLLEWGVANTADLLASRVVVQRQEHVGEQVAVDTASR